MLYEDIAWAAEGDQLIENKDYEDEECGGIETEKLVFDHVRFIRCRFGQSNFEKGEFHDVLFEECDLSNGVFRNGYFKNCRFRNCRMYGSIFESASLKDTHIENCNLAYGNFSKTLWECTEVTDSNMKQSSLAESVFRKPVFHRTDLSGTDFFRTKLKGIDLSDCTIHDILVSDTFSELAGLKVDLYQAAELAKLLRIQIK